MNRRFNPRPRSEYRNDTSAPNQPAFTRDQLLTIKTALHLEIDRNLEHAARSAVKDPEVMERNAQIVAALEDALQAVNAAI